MTCRKSVFLFLFCFFLFFSSLQAACRDSVRLVTGGIKVEANASGYIMPDVSKEIAEVSPGPGATLGGFVFFDFHKHFGLQMELLYHLRTARMFQYTSSSEAHAGDFLYAGCEVPFYLIVHWALRDCSRFYLAVGPTVEFGYYAQVKSGENRFDLYKKDDETQLSAMQDVNMGFGLSVGYEFAFGLQLNLACKVSCYNILDEHRSEVSAYPYSLSAGVAYRFGLDKGKGGRDAR